MEFSKKEQLFKIGEKIYPVDFSSFNKNGEHVDNEDEIKDKLMNGIPFIVVSLPFFSSYGWFENEYFINVRMEGDNNTYAIFNSDCNVFKNHFGYVEFIADCEMCAAFGY